MKRNMVILIALSLVGVLLMPALAETYNEGQLSFTASECFTMGKAVAGMELGKSMVQQHILPATSYNDQIPTMNALVKQHNDFIMGVFAGNAIALSRLLVEPYYPI
jgi:hypothetical protein